MHKCPDFRPDMREQALLTTAASKTARKFSSLFHNALTGHRPIQTLKIGLVNSVLVSTWLNSIDT